MANILHVPASSVGPFFPRFHCPVKQRHGKGKHHTVIPAEPVAVPQRGQHMGKFPVPHNVTLEKSQRIIAQLLQQTDQGDRHKSRLS